jgi:DNA polymerase-3 subunit beta
MTFTVDKKQFIKALQSVMPAVSKRGSLPVLSGVKITGADTRYALEATDLELAISLQAPAKGDGLGDPAVVPAKGLLKAVKSMPEDEVSIEVEANEDRSRVKVTSGARKVAIDGYSPAEWPEVARSDRKSQAVCWFDAEQLADALSRIVLCASSDEARPVLTGVQFTFGNDTLELAATDSYRLGYLKLATEQMGEVPDLAPIVPARVLKALAKQLKKDKGRGIIYVGSQGAERDIPLVEFSFGGATCWMTRAIAGEFPNWRQLVPKETGGSFEFDSEELSAAVKGASELRTNKSVPVKVQLDDSCELKMEDAQAASVAESLPAASYSPNGVGPMVIAFNPDFLLDAVSFLAEERGRMRATDPYKPALFQGEADEQGYVLMPVRLPS